MSIYKGNKKIAGLIRGEDISHATETHAGIIEIATQGEVLGGASDSKAVTPTKLKQYYYGKVETNDLLNNKQDTLTAGTGIKIENNIISNTQTSAEWGNIQGDIADQTDLSNRLTTIDDRIEDLTTARFPNVVIVGTPHIEGGQVSNYSSTSYLQFPFVDISRGQPFDIYFSFTTAQDITTQQNILDAYFGIALAIQNGKGVMALSSNGTSWDIGNTTGTNTLLPNTTYYVKYSWTGTQYNASLSTDDETYVPDMIINSTLSPHKTTIFIGGSPNIFGAGSSHPFKGTINFNKSKVVVNGITVWEGMADVGLASRANVSLNNLDEVGEKRFTDLQDDINTKANSSDLTAHTSNETIHVTSTDKETWNNKQNKLTAGTNITIDETTNTISASSGLASVSWGGITGTLSNQTDLNTALGKKANDSDAVHKTGNENINGVKTFTGGTGENNVAIKAPNGIAIGGVAQTAYSQFGTIRLVNNAVNTGSYYIDGNGSVLFRHKTGSATAEGSANDVMFTMNPVTGIKAGFSGTAGKGITDADTHDVLIDTVSYSKLTTTAKDVLGAINELNAKPSGDTSWGSITGTLSNQTDLQTALSNKQNTIADLESIRSGAELGATALQSIPSEYITETELSNYHDNTKQNALTAGSNITITDNVISSTGGTKVTFRKWGV